MRCLANLRTFFLLVLGLFFSVFFISPVFAAESVQQFQVEAEVKADRSVQFQETIKYDFDDQWKHGIFRFIPTNYRRSGLAYKLRLHLISVLMDGKTVPFETSSELGDMRIQIGDPESLIKGVHTYQIVYETDRALNDFADHQELYWNVTGNQWEVPIQQAIFRVHAPTLASNATCYTGISGSREQQCTSSKKDQTVEFKTTHALSAYEGLTIVTAFPYGSIQHLAWYTYAWQLMQDNFLLGIPFLVFFFMFFAWYRWGREPRGRGTIIPQYEEPQGLTPAMLSALEHQSVGLPVLAATFLDLARRGYLVVVFPAADAKKKDAVFILRKKREADEKMLPFEKTLFEGLFADSDEITLDQRQDNMWKVYQSVRDQLLQELKTRGWLRKNPAVVRATWMFIAFVFVFAGFMLSGFGGAIILIAFICAVIVAAFGWNMPQMTKDGAILLEEIEGFKQFLSVTEKDRLAFSDAPARSPEQFARFLPAAVALGVEDKWSQHFADMTMPPPSYFQSGPGFVWNASLFSHSMSQFKMGISHNVAAPSSSAGGGGSGFSSGGGSGGGFGGGGGGSW